MTKAKFTKAYLDALPPSQKKGWDAYYDEKAPGLALFVFPSGKKTFYVQRKLNGRVERIKIGSYPQTTIEQARAQTTAVNAAILANNNPAAVKRALKTEPTFSKVFNDFLEAKKNRTGRGLADTTKQDYRDVLDKHLNPIKQLKLSEVTPDRLRGIHCKIPSPSQANRAKALVSSVFSWAKKQGLTDLSAPTELLNSHVIQSRDRFLQPNELATFFNALESSPLRDFFLLCLLTGARSGNVSAMSWDHIDLAEGVWKIPKTKNGESQLVTLVPDAIGILTERKGKCVVNEGWVFPGRGKTGHLVAPRKAWYRLLEVAGLREHLRIHDLRRTLGSYQARQGASLSIIGKSLGHKSQQATAIYARLDLDPVRQSVEQATAEILALSKVRSTEPTND